MIKGTPLKCFMEQNNYNCEFVAKASGINVETIRNVIKGRSISPKTISKLCQTFKLQPCDIIEWEEVEKRGHWVFIAGDDIANT